MTVITMSRTEIDRMSVLRDLTDGGIKAAGRIDADRSAGCATSTGSARWRKRLRQTNMRPGPLNVGLSSTNIHIRHEWGRNKAGVKVKAHDLNGRRAASASILSFEIIRTRRITDFENRRMGLMHLPIRKSSIA